MKKEFNVFRFTKTHKANRLTSQKKLRNSEFSTFQRANQENIDLSKLELYGLMMWSESEQKLIPDVQFYTLYHEVIVDIEEAMVMTTASAQSPEIKELVGIISTDLSSIYEAIEGASKASYAPNRGAGLALISQAKIIPNIKRLPQEQLLEEASAVLHIMLKPENAKYLTTIAQLTFAKHVISQIQKAQTLINERKNDKVSTSCEELREVCMILYTYIFDKVEAKANGDASSEEAIDLINKHNALIDATTMTYNQRTGHKDHIEDTDNDDVTV